MAVKESTKEAVKLALLKGQPLFNVDQGKQALISWLTNAGFPPPAPASDWDKAINTFPPEPGDANADAGRRVRLAFRLFTPRNRYVIMIMESFVPENRGVYSLMACVGWHKDELALQQSIEKVYTGRFDDDSRPLQTIWAQNFKMTEFDEALDATAKAILGRELKSEPPDDSTGSPISHPPTERVSFPSRADE